MNDLVLTVRRSALLMWLLAVSGVPFIIFGVDLLFERRLATSLTDIIYPTERVTPPPFETHDLAWAWVLLIAGAVMTTWALKELIAPRRIVHADETGVAIAVSGPLAASVQIPWSAIDDVTADIDHDEGGVFPVLLVHMSEPERLPIHPWGARWVGEGVLSIAAGEWDVEAGAAAERLLEFKELHAEPSDRSLSDGPSAYPGTDEAQSDPTPLPTSLIDGPWVRQDADLVEEYDSRDSDALFPDEEQPTTSDVESFDEDSET